MPVLDQGDTFETMHGTSYDPGAPLDQMKQSSHDVLWSKKIMGTTGDGTAIPSPAIQNYIDTLAKSNPDKAQYIIDYIKNMSKIDIDNTLSSSARKSGAAVNALKSIVKSKFG